MVRSSSLHFKHWRQFRRQFFTGEFMIITALEITDPETGSTFIFQGTDQRQVFKDAAQWAADAGLESDMAALPLVMTQSYVPGEADWPFNPPPPLQAEA